MMENFIYKLSDKLNKQLNRFFKTLHDLKSKAMKTPSLYSFSFLFIFLLLWILLFILNRNTPMVIDDFHYSFGLGAKRIGGLWDAIGTQYSHYFLWSGRVVAHVIAQYILYLETWLADLLNSLVYVVYSYLLYLHAIGKSKKHSLLTLLLILSASFILQPAFGETCLWLTGSANYLWCSVLVLSFLLPYRRYEGGRAKYMIVKTLGMSVLGLLAGWTNENTGLGLIIMLILFIIYFRIQNFKIPVWAISGLAFSFIAYLFMILAPGNAVRIEILALEGQVGLAHILKAFIFSTLQTIEWFGLLNLLLVIGILFVLNSKKERQYKLKMILPSAIYFIGFLVSLYAMCFSPFFPTRSWFGILTFNIIAVAAIVHQMEFTSTVMWRIKVCAIILSVLSFFDLYYVAYIQTKRVDKLWADRIETIENNKKLGEETVFIIRKSDSPYAIEATIHMSEPVSKYYGTKVVFEECAY